MAIRNFITTGTTFKVIVNGFDYGTWSRFDEVDSKYDVDVRDNAATLSLRNPYYSDNIFSSDTIQVNGTELSGTFRDKMEALKNQVLYLSSPGSALPTETVATYSAMQTSITADPTTKRDFFVTADETNGGAKTSYRYDGTGNNRLMYLIADSFDTLTDSRVVAWSFSDSNKKKKVTLAGNRSLALEGTQDGDTGLLAVIQDGTGSRTLWLPGVVETGFALSTTANTLDILAFVNVNGVLYWTVKKLGVPVSSMQYLTWAYVTANLTAANKGFVRDNTAAAFNAFARSAEQIATGKYLQAREGNSSTSFQKMVGLTTVLSPNNFNQLSFAMYTDSTSPALYKVESGTITSIGTYAADDHFRVFYDGTFIRYQKSSDGYTWTTVNTSSLTPSGSYYAMLAFSTGGASLVNIHKSI